MIDSEEAVILVSRLHCLDSYHRHVIRRYRRPDHEVVVFVTQTGLHGVKRRVSRCLREDLGLD